MMPGAAHARPGYDALGERAMIVSAVGPDREHFAAASHQQHFLAADVPDQLASAKLGACDALREIGTCWCLLLCHRGCSRRSGRHGEKFLAHLRVIAKTA